MFFFISFHSFSCRWYVGGMGGGVVLGASRQPATPTLLIINLRFVTAKTQLRYIVSGGHTRRHDQ
jgi:hypothetical protein